MHFLIDAWSVGNLGAFCDQNIKEMTIYIYIYICMYMKTKDTNHEPAHQLSAYVISTT